MSLFVVCRSCERKLRVQPHCLGKSLRCPHCQHKFKVAAKPVAAAAKRATASPPKSQPARVAAKPGQPRTVLKPGPARRTTLSSRPPASSPPPEPEKISVRKTPTNERKTTLAPRTVKTTRLASPPIEESPRCTSSTPAPSAGKKPTPQAVFPGHFRYYVLGAVGLVLVAGTLAAVFFRGEDRRALFPVEGKVVIREVGILAGGQVTFFEVDSANPLDPSADDKRVSAKGTIKADGTFILGTYQEGDGAPEGRYKVLVNPPRPPDPENPPEIWPPFNVRYARYHLTPLLFTVMPHSNRCELELER